MTLLKKICTICGKEFETPKYYSKRKTCSIECRYKQVSISAKNSKNSGRFNSGFIPWNKGLTKDDDERLKIVSQKAKEQMEREYSNGTRNRFEITKAANKKCRELIQNGCHALQNIDTKIISERSRKNCEKLKSQGRLGFQNYNIQLKARSTCAGHSRGGSYIENMMKKLLDELNIDYIEQFMIIHPTIHKRYFVDFMIPNKRIIIECDGSNWHQDISKDNYRQSIIEYYGYKVLRFTGNEIINNLEKIKIDIIRSFD